MKKLISFALCVVMLLTAIVPAYGAETTGVVNAPGDAVAEAKITAAPCAFSVTVPSALPISMDSVGSIYTATNARIVNASAGPIEVKNVDFEPVNGWSAVAHDKSFVGEQMDQKKIGFIINEAYTTEAGFEFVEAGYPVIRRDGELALTYDAVVAPQSTSVVSKKVADVIFIIGWYGIDINTIFLSDGNNDETGVEKGTTAVIVANGPDSDEYSWSNSNRSVVELVVPSEPVPSSLNTASDGGTSDNNYTLVPVDCTTDKVNCCNLTNTGTIWQNWTTSYSVVGYTSPLPIPSNTMAITLPSIDTVGGNDGIAFYDSDKSFLCSLTRTTMSSLISGCTEYPLPEGAAYYRMYGFNYGTLNMFTPNKFSWKVATETPSGPEIGEGDTVQIVMAGRTISLIALSPGTSNISVSLNGTLIASIDVTVYEVVEPRTFTVSYDANGGNTVTIPTTFITEGESVTVTNIVPTTDNTETPIFYGWCLNPEGSGSIYTSGAQVEPTDNIVFYAKWAPTEPAVGAIYTDDYYEYRYGQHLSRVGTTTETEWVTPAVAQHGWGVKVLDNTVTSCASPLFEVYGHPIVSLQNTYYNCQKLTTLNTSAWDTSNIVDLTETFMCCYNLASIDVSDWDVSNVKSLKNTFSYCSVVKEIDVSEWDTKSVTDINGVFNWCVELTQIDVAGWNVSHVTNMDAAFNYCKKLQSIDLSKWDTRNVKNFIRLFQGCWALTEIDLSNFNTESATLMGLMFSGCCGATSIDVSNFDTSNVTDMQGMFNGASKITSLDLSHFDTSNVEDMSRMFCDCSKLAYLDISNFNLEKVQFYGGGHVHQMFSSCPMLKHAYVENASLRTWLNSLGTTYKPSTLTFVAKPTT